MTRLNKKETESIMQVLKGFGFQLQGGSSEIREDGTIVYHLAIYKGSACTVGPKLGPILKNALHADEIYEMGIRLAWLSPPAKSPN